jgi:hypothetical protein
MHLQEAVHGLLLDREEDALYVSHLEDVKRFLQVVSRYCPCHTLQIFDKDLQDMVQRMEKELAKR